MDEKPEEQPVKSVRRKHGEASIAHRAAVEAWKVWQRSQDEKDLERAQAMSAEANALTLAAAPQARTIEEHQLLQQHHAVRRNTARL